MDLNIGSMFIGNTKLENVKLTGLSGDDFLSLLSGKELPEEKPKPIVDKRKEAVFDSDTAVSVKLTNIITGESKTYVSMSKAAKDIGVALSTITKAVKKNQDIIKHTWKIEKITSDTYFQPVIKDSKHISFDQYSSQLRSLIHDAGRDAGKVLSEAYKLETSVYGVSWDGAKKAFRSANGGIGTTLQIAYWLEDSNKVSKGTLEKCVKEILKSV